LGLEGILLSLLEIVDLYVSYGKAAILQGITMMLESEELAAVIGPNGAGKTTLVRTISGLTPGRGNIRFEGNVINHLPPYEIVKKRIVLCPERRRLFSGMTVWRNLEMGAYLRKDKVGFRRDLDKIFVLFPRLKEREKNLAGTLSGGEQQMLAVARSLMSNPKLLMLDEPSFGLAPKVKETISGTLKEIRKEGITILLTEQDSRLAFSTAEKIYVMENGQITIEGNRENVIADKHVKEAYLGLA
jgi:branched-chain amino acid transport system ATP-binding protein